MITLIKSAYSSFVLKQPVLVCLLMAILLGFFAMQTKDFKLDASADSLLLEDDKDLKLFRETLERYATKDFLFVTFSPKEDLFSQSSLDVIIKIRDDFRTLEPVESVISLVDVPLVRQIEGTISDVADNVRTIEGGGLDIEKVKQELLNSPIYRELIISEDGQTTAIQVNLKDSPEFRDLQRERNQLLIKANAEGLDVTEQTRLDEILIEYTAQKNVIDKVNHDNIVDVREIISKYQQYGTLHMGGVTMITDDMITYIKNDLIVFGVGVFLFLVGMLSIIFRKLRWVMLPLLSCFYAGLLMIGLLSLVGWHVTVISSNFISLMLIITMSMNVHLIVRYRQLFNDYPELSQHELVLSMASKMVWPCLYTALTTIMAFSSLVVSGIKPIIDFGWMMTIGLSVTFLTSFILFPSILGMLAKGIEKSGSKDEFQFTSKLASMTEIHGNKILIITVILAAVSTYGISRLEVENSFINYFSDSTEIYKGLRLIDEKMGGTTPMDIIINLEDDSSEDDSSEEGEFEDFDALFGAFSDGQDEIWFTPERIDTIKQVHDHLETFPAIGKVLSLASIIRVGEEINEAEFDAFELAIITKNMPDEIKESMITPYVSEENNEARISIRILDSLKDLRRKELLEQIKTDLVEKIGLAEDKVQITGILVLYNNMLQSLFKSQILTLGVVMAGIALMLVILFRSFTLAIIGIIPNILAAAIILGLMGLLRIPLDMMTITIAAITIGIAVDNSIHYIYRFREELPKTGDYVKTMHYCHANIGKAVFYTAITIIIGFSILVLSNFIPTIYFGLLTALAMFIALFACLTLLPKLILIFKPFD
ncbi:MAG: putative RND superfamily exporter protein [Gammaproteobacteria bacterium]|jgi:predicted RND superfamily exporter protein